MNLEWIILAEGLGTDAKDAVTLIGLNQNVFMTPVLPAPTKRAVVAHLLLEDEEVFLGASARFAMRVEAPSGTVLSASSGGGELSPGLNPDLPSTLDIPAQMALMITEYGTHKIIVEITGPFGDQCKGEVLLFVAPPPSNMPGGIQAHIYGARPTPSATPPRISPADSSPAAEAKAPSTSRVSSRSADKKASSSRRSTAASGKSTPKRAGR